MMRALLASHNQELYELTISCTQEIADHVRDPHIEAITSACGRFDFWMTPSLRPAHQRVNRPATRMLLRTTRFGAAQVPIMTGNIVVTSHDRNGQLAGLSRAQLDRLVSASYTPLSPRSEWLLDWRFSRVSRAQRRRVRAEAAAQWRRFWDGLRAGHEP